MGKMKLWRWQQQMYKQEQMGVQHQNRLQKNQVLGQPPREGMLPINSRLQDLAMANVFEASPSRRLGVA